MRALGHHRSVDLILAMDRGHQRELLARSPAAHRHKIRADAHATTSAGADPDVADPYYGGMEGFERMYEVLQVCCRNLLDALLERRRGVRPGRRPGLSAGSRAALEAALREALADPGLAIRAVRPIGGGCISPTARIETRAGAFFAKWNEAGPAGPLPARGRRTARRWRRRRRGSRSRT